MKTTKQRDLTVYAPLNGKAVAITEVPDEVFSEKVLGDGIAIIPEDGRVLSPVDGVITGTRTQGLQSHNLTR